MVPELSSARYSTFTLPSRTIAAGLKVCSTSHWTGFFTIGSLNVDAALGEITGLPVAGRVNGPMTQPGRFCPCEHAAKRIANNNNAARLFIDDRPSFSLLLSRIE